MDILTAPIVPDVVLDHWGDIYRSNPTLAKLGYTFEQYLAVATRFPLISSTYSLLPKQAAVRDRIANLAADLDPPYTSIGL